MKTHILILALALVAMLSTVQAADTPAAIASDYRARAEPALAKVNETLERATVPIIADLVKAGDTAGAEELKTQLKAKQAGETVAKPHAKAANLFTLYDAARLKALEPAQTAAVARIDALLKSSDGKKLEVVEEAGKARAEIESGHPPPEAPKVPVDWTYHSTAASQTVMATVKFLPNGTFEMSNQPPGKWKANSKGDQITITLTDKTVWKVKIDGKVAEIDRPDVGVRYLKVAQK